MELPWELYSLFSLLAQLLNVAVKVLFACAAYQDAKSLNSKETTLWAVLIGIFGLIPGIIYLCVRKRNAIPPEAMQQVCYNCRVLLIPGTIICPCCGAQQPIVNPYLFGYRSPQECLECRQKAKKLLIAAIVCTGIMIVIWGVLIASVVAEGVEMFEYYDIY